MLKITATILVLALALIGLSVKTASADPSGTCPYEYCEYVSPWLNAPPSAPFYPAPWHNPSPTPEPERRPVVVVINNAPLPTPTPARGPVHYGDDADFNPCTYRLFKVASQKGC